MATSPSARHRQLLWLVAAVAAVGAGVLSLRWRWLETAEHLSITLRFQARGVAAAAPQSVIVGVAESSLSLAERAAPRDRGGPLALMQPEWPWNRAVFAEVVRRLRDHGARVIIFDLVFAGENAGDAEFARAIAEPGAPVVLASFVDVERSALGEATVRIREPREALGIAAGERVGYATVFPDDDGVLRGCSTTMQVGEFLGLPPVAGARALPSLAFAAWKAAGGLKRPLPAAGEIDFCGPAGTIPVVPVEDLFLPDRWKNSLPQSGRLFRDRIVWVGPVAENPFKDVHTTPLGRMTGVEVQAQTLEMLLGRGPLRTFSDTETAALVWLLAAAGVLLAWTALRISRQLALVVGGALGWAALAYVLFVAGGVVRPFVAPVSA